MSRQLVAKQIWQELSPLLTLHCKASRLKKAIKSDPSVFLTLLDQLKSGELTGTKTVRCDSLGIVLTLQAGSTKTDVWLNTIESSSKNASDAMASTYEDLLKDLAVNQKKKSVSNRRGLTQQGLPDITSSYLDDTLDEY